MRKATSICLARMNRIVFGRQLTLAKLLVGPALLLVFAQAASADGTALPDSATAAQKQAKDTAAIKVLGLKECIALAQSQSTAALKGTYAVNQAGADVLLNYGQFLPDLNFGAGYNYASGRQDLTASVPTFVDASKSTFNYQLVSSVNLFTGLQNKAALKAALLKKEGAQLSLEHALQQVAFDVTQSFLQVMLDKRLVEFANENLQVSFKREDQLKELTAVGRKVKSDFYQQVAQTSADKLYSITMLNNLKKDELTLFRKLRLSNAKAYEVGDYQADVLVQPVTPEQEGNLIAKAIAQRGDLKAAQLNKDAAAWAVTKAKSGFIPKLNLTYGVFEGGGYFYNAAVDGINVLPASQPNLGNQLFGQINGMVGLNTTWAIFDKNLTRSAIASSKINAQIAALDAEDMQLDIVTQLQQGVGDYNAALQQVETAEQGLQAAQAAFEGAQPR